MANHPKLTCLCGAISQTVNVSLPSPTELCHCNPCRKVSGALAPGFVELPEQPDTTTLDKCSIYWSSSTHNRRFCSSCGSKTLVHLYRHEDGRERNDWFAYAGAVERAEGETPSNISRVDFNMWLDDAVDGGLAPYLTNLGGRDIPSYHISDSDPPLSQQELQALVQHAKSKSNDIPGADERLKAECRCGAVKLLIKPADHTDKSIRRPDNIVPFDPTTTERNPRKYSVRACACRSCRLATGVSLTQHTYIPPPQILNSTTGEPLAYGPAASTAEGRAANRGLEAMKYYQSTDEVWRTFCGTCGSTVYYWNIERPDIVNIAAGILQAEEGVLARRWLYWQPGMVSFEEEAVDKDIVEAYIKADVN